METKRKLCLSCRLQAIAALIPRDCRVADIGTDHGYLPVWLLQNGAAQRVIACDVRPGPLEHARRSAAQYGLDRDDRLLFRLGDGLDCVAPEEVDTIVIAGMGGETIQSILEAAPWTNDAAYQLLLQPMTKAEVLRRFLAKQGYTIAREHLVYENHTYFPVMNVRGGGQPEQLPLGQMWGGVALDHDPLQGRALDAMIAQLSLAQQGLERASRPEHAERAAQNRKVLHQLQQMKEAWLRANCSGD